MTTLALNRCRGGKISTAADLLIKVPWKSIRRVQELYLPIYHYLCQKVEQRLSIFIAVSTRESFGVSVLEAAACGIPAITSNVGGLPEVNKHDETGIVILPERPNELAEKIIYLYKNNQWRLKLGNNARRRVVSDFNWDKSVSQMLKIYDKLCP